MPETTSSLSDEDIINDLLKDSKFSIHSLVSSLGESTSSLYREKIVNLMNSCIDEHFRLCDFAIQKKWYQPSLQPDEILQQDLNITHNLVQ